MSPAVCWFGRCVFDGILAAAIVIGWFIGVEELDDRRAHDPGSGWDAA